MGERRAKRVVPWGTTRLSPAQRATSTFGVALAAVGVLVLTQACGSSTQEPKRVAASSTAADPTPTSPSGASTSTSTPAPTPARTAAPTPRVTVRASPRPTASAQPKPLSTVQPRRAVSTLGPMSLSAPSIGVRGALKRTEARNGVVNPPSGVLTWISGYGRVRPGEVGTAVIAGHVVNGRRADVFYRLQDIDRGDRVTVVDSDGKPVVYTVTATRVATKTSVSRDPAVWGSNRSVRRIALITCDDDQGFRADGHRVANFVAIAEAS